LSGAGPSGPARSPQKETFGASAIASLEKRGVLDVAEHPGEDDGREALLVGVVGGGRVVERLAGERHLVFGGGELLAQLHHVLVGLEVRVGFHHREESPDGSRQRPLGAAQPLDGRGVGGVARRPLQAGARLVPGLDHGIERLALVGHVALRGLHQVGNQIVAPLELNLDLRERILVTVAKRDELVEDAHRGGDEQQRDSTQNDQCNHGRSPMDSGRQHIRTVACWLTRSNRAPARVEIESLGTSSPARRVVQPGAGVIRFVARGAPGCPPKASEPGQALLCHHGGVLTRWTGARRVQKWVSTLPIRGA